MSDDYDNAKGRNLKQKFRDKKKNGALASKRINYKSLAKFEQIKNDKETKKMSRNEANGNGHLEYGEIMSTYPTYWKKQPEEKKEKKPKKKEKRYFVMMK